jgi:subtilase family serine protease
MKKFLYTIFFAAWALLANAQDPAYPLPPAIPQNIVAAEYFIDNDPGYGNATQIAVAPGIDIINAAFNASVNGLSNGIHRIVVRTRSNEGRWSIVMIREFLVDFDPPYANAPATPQNILAVEYFIDTDPGPGNGTPISITPGTDLNNVGAAINVTGLAAGTHRLYIRSKSQEGRWAITAFKEFLIDSDPNYTTPPAAPQNIVAAEYFYDTDPSFGNGTPVSLTPATDISNFSFNANTSGLTTGTHRLYFRTKNNEGSWAITLIKDFIVDNDPGYPVAPLGPQNITAAEYFIDTDPGAGNATPIAITPATDINAIAFNANTTGLTLGTHRIYLRTRNNEGRWAITLIKDFIVDENPAYPTPPATPVNITAAEYFIDNDPGIGNGASIAVNSAVDISNVSFNANTSGLSNGKHTLYLRTRSQQGKWSITNIDTFMVGTISINPDTLSFGTININTIKADSIVITNNSSVVQSINQVTVAAPFSTSFAGTINIPAGQSRAIPVSFSPTAAGLFTSNATIETTAGNYAVYLAGRAQVPLPAWTIEPAVGHSYGSVQTGTSASFSFTVRNTGNVPVTLSSATSGNPAFVPVFTAGTVIPVGGTIQLPVSFNPVAVAAYSATLKLTSGAGGADSVTTALSGNGFTPTTPPTLTFIGGAPYSNVSGVNPQVGQTGLYTYKILYRSSDNRAPASTYPRVGIDMNGDQDFDDAGEGIYQMTKETAGTDYVTGVVYSYTANYTNYSSTMGYRFFANDELGNAATSSNAIYYAGPTVTFQQLDLKLFANNITFNKSNPLPGEQFIVTATITNNSAYTATNVPVRFYRDTIPLGDGVIPVVGAFATASINKSFSFAAEGFYPIKVWIDPDETLSESNVLNNYAIRPIVVGNPVLPGGINITASAAVQNCPLRLVISGNAQYFNTSTPTVVAGAAVTINTGTELFTTTTDVNGNFNLLIENPSCGNVLTYTVSVTDFTFTSNTFTGSVSIPCPTAGACAPPPSMGGVSGVITSSTNPCDQTVGSTASVNIIIKYRGRNAANMWSLWDKIWKDTVKVFHNGVLVQTFYTNDIPDFGSAGTFPGDEKIYPVNIVLDTAGPNVITAVATYQYNEFFQNETPFYKGTFTNMTSTGGVTIFSQTNKPDLTLGNVVQTSFTSFTFQDQNNKCGTAGAHIVRILDVTGTPVVLADIPVAGLGSNSTTTLTGSFPGLSIGTHRIRIVTDTTSLVDEANEGNNAIEFDWVVPAPDLLPHGLINTISNLQAGSSTTFQTRVVNTGTATPGSFTVRFFADNVQIGADKTIASLGERSDVVITSDPWTVTTTPNNCPVTIRVVVDNGMSVTESNEANNERVMQLGTDLDPTPLPGEFGSSSNPTRVRVNTSKTFNAYIRNIGTRDVENVTVKFMLAGAKIGEALVPHIPAGKDYPAVATFTYTFTVPGNVVVTIVTDTANLACEILETNNTASYHVVVTDSKEDLEVLSQYISPSSLNPAPGQNITIVGTVKNIGNRTSPATSLRFLVDDIQLGTDVPFNSLLPGQDTTVSATVTYSSLIGGLKVMKIVADPGNIADEESELNNDATRILIVGDAPDMRRLAPQSIRFNPSGFEEGDSVVVSQRVRNSGSQPGTAWMKFRILDETDAVIGLDSVQFTLLPNTEMTINRKMLFNAAKGQVITDIVHCTPVEYDLLNNSDTLHFSTVGMLKSNIVVSGDLDMKAAIQEQLPGWIGGKLLLGQYDLTVNGRVLNYDTAHFIITNGAGKLRLVNNAPDNLFPVGPELFRHNFVKISNSGVQDNFSVRVLPYALKNGTAGDTILTGNVDRTWMIEEDVTGGSNATLQLWWNAADELPNFDRNTSRVAHYVTGWQLGAEGMALVDSIGRFSRTQTGYTSFSPFTITSSNLSVPLMFLSFKASNSNNDVLLAWITDNETNTSHFDVEYSLDGVNYTTLTRLTSANTPGQHKYQYLHVSPAANLLYYRIRQVDIDGKFTYSKVVVITRKSKQGMLLYPNPAQAFVMVKNVAAADVKEIRIIGADGKLVSTSAVNGQLQVDVSRLKNGMYFMNVIMKDGSSEMRSFVKQ